MPAAAGKLWQRSYRQCGPISTPEIRPNYLSTDEDCRVHVAGMRIALQIMESDIMVPMWRMK